MTHDDDRTSRAADLVELMLHEISSARQDWGVVAGAARQLTDVAGGAASEARPTLCLHRARRVVLRGATVALPLAGALYLSHQAGLPHGPSGSLVDLPPVALDWPLLFHVVRATALLAAVGVVLLVGWRATHGELPIRLGQVEYPARGVAAEAALADAAHERRIRRLESLQGFHDPGAPQHRQRGVL